MIWVCSCSASVVGWSNRLLLQKHLAMALLLSLYNILWDICIRSVISTPEHPLKDTSELLKCSCLSLWIRQRKQEERGEFQRQCQPWGKTVRFREPQNCSGRKGPLEIIKSNFPAKAGSLDQVTQVGIRQVLNICKEGDSTTSLISLLQCSVTLTVKKFLRTLLWNFLCSSLSFHHALLH